MLLLDYGIIPCNNKIFDFIKEMYKGKRSDVLAQRTVKT